MNRFILYMIKYKLVYGTICKNTSKHAKSYSIRKLHKNVIILKVQLFFYDKLGAEYWLRQYKTDFRTLLSIATPEKKDCPLKALSILSLYT